MDKVNYETAKSQIDRINATASDMRRNDMRIGRTVWSMEIDGDPRIRRLARWYGFKDSTHMLIAFRGN